MEYALTEIINLVDELCMKLSGITKEFVINMEEALRTGTSEKYSNFV